MHRASLRGPSGIWLRALLVAGAVLAVALLIQTVVNYRYVSTNLIRQEARRVAEETVRSIERAARLSRPQDAESFRTILADISGDTPDQIAAVTLLQADGSIVAAIGWATPLALEARQRTGRERGATLQSEVRDGRNVLVGLFPCRCSLPAAPTAVAGQPSAGRLLLEIAVYPDEVSAPFARLRRNATISASAALALLVSVSLIAARLGSYVRGKQLESQVELARQVQRDLLPAPEAWPSNIDMAAECVPAWAVGGDFFDITALPGNQVAFALGDVSGHGISAALLMGLIHGAMASPPWGFPENEADRAAARLNQLLLAKSSGERFASLLWCVYDPGSSKLRYLNAGHPPPLWIRQAPNGTCRVERLKEGGPVLGLLTAAVYKTASVEAQAGDLLVVFSDGIVEAANKRAEQFGEDRLIAVAIEQRGRSARAICEAILAAVRTFSDGKPAEDDQTLLVVRLWSAT